jgi:hypothetical protein
LLSNGEGSAKKHADLNPKLSWRLTPGGIRSGTVEISGERSAFTAGEADVTGPRRRDPAGTVRFLAAKEEMGWQSQM